MSHKIFPSQQPNEKIMLVVREHWFLFGLKILAIALLMSLPVVIRILMAILGFELASDTINSLLSVGVQLYYLGLLVALFIIWVLYYLNVHVVTDQRIVDIDQVGLLFREVSELNIETIEDVTSQNIGIFGNFLNYGTVFIQTAGAAQRFEFNNVPNPGEIASLILKLYEEHSNSKGKENPKP
ncbi:PH domain-containing protein [bacterium]|nr:MAG: PH domain-containing protein [bacterium]